MGARKEYMDIAWEVARKLINLSDKDRENIFGYSDVGRIIKNHSVNITEYKIAIYKEELKKEEIEVGDIVKCDFLLREGIVINIIYDIDCNTEYHVIFSDGEHKTFLKDELTRTGRNVDILNILNNLIVG